MNNPKKVSPSNRYFKARLEPFARPIFWLSGGMLVLLLVIVWQYWTHPEWIGASIDDEDSLAAISQLNQQNNNTPPTTTTQTAPQQGQITLPDPSSIVKDPVADLKSNVEQLVEGTPGQNVQQATTGGIQQQPTPTNVQQPTTVPDPQKLGIASSPRAGLVADKKLYEQVVALPELFPPLLGASNVSVTGGLLPGAGTSQEENTQQPPNTSYTAPPTGIPAQPSALETAVNRVLSTNNNPTVTGLNQVNPTYPTQGYPTQAYPTQAYPTQAYPGQTVPGQVYPGQTVPGQAYPTQAYPGVGGYNQPVTTPVPQTNPYNAYNPIPGTTSGVMNNLGQVTPGSYGQVTPGVSANTPYQATPTVPGIGYNQVPQTTYPVSNGF